MSIESPATYGEHYWSSQLDAATAFEERIEKGLADFIMHPFANPDIRAAIPRDIMASWDAVFSLQDQAAGKIAAGVMSSALGNVENSVISVAMRPAVYMANRLHQNEFVDPSGTINQFRRALWDADFTKYRLKMYGYSESETSYLLQATKEYPPLTEIIRWARYEEYGHNLWTHVAKKYRVEESDQELWTFMTRQQFSTDQILNLYKRGAIEQAYMGNKLEELGWFGGWIAELTNLAYVIPNAQILLQGNLLADASTEDIFSDLGHADIHPDYRQKYLDAVLIKPNASDLVNYHLRQENSLSGLDEDLTRIGIHPRYFASYHMLADRLPPLSDIITMAVREAFSPSIAARFGQYEDFPKEFARYAKMQGMSEEWAQRYWAAHWGLPSPQQGFEMLHRGIIETSDLALLLKAQDVMPFWREKLIKMAYKPVSRVDVRRMYKEGVFDVKEVLQAYLNIGYDDDNAAALTEFTVKQTLSSMAKFSSTDIVKAFTNRIIDKGEASSLLRMLGTRSEDASYIISTAEYKREWDLVESRIAAIRNLYKRGEHNENQARSELLKLDLRTDQVEVLMETWWFEAKEITPPTWSKAETIKYLKAGLITDDRAREELRRMEYDQEHIDIYIKAITWQPPNNSETT